jgi:hypothetical protein
VKVKEQRARRAAVMCSAWRAYFTGAGAAPRRLSFARSLAAGTVGWSLQLMCLASWAVVAGLLAGPRHEAILREFHGWVRARAFDELLAQGHHAFLFILAWSGGFMSLVLALGRELSTIAEPALEQAELALASPGA